MIYLDNAATTKPSQSAIDMANVAMSDNFGNPSSLHTIGYNAEKAIDKARRNVLNTLQLPSEIKGKLYFTSGGTEGSNLAIIGAYNAMRVKGAIITSKLEHKCVLNAVAHLQSKGAEVRYCNVTDDGIIDLEHFSQLMDDNVCLVSIMHVNNEIGSIQPIDKVAEIIAARGSRAIFHTDNVQGFGKVPLVFGRVNGKVVTPDIITVSAHKIGGLKGCGAIFIKDKVKVEPIIWGGGQESGVRSGTENTVGICAFGAACEGLNRDAIDENFKRISEYKNYLSSMIRDNIKNASFMNSQVGSPYILSVSLPSTPAEVILHSLEERGVYVSTGSACSSNSHTLSDTLLACNVPRDIIKSAVRISFSPSNTFDEVKQAGEILIEVMDNLGKR
ncbi:MAG: cysteine desulfurase [Clostridiales bacterium]|jgi:cysteine desulfurase|nr:cysteine desulfurase [Clostridiales bacterium]